MGDRVKIIIAAHKKYPMPKDEIYIPVHVGAEGKTDKDGKPLDLGYAKDNTGDNISLKNPKYCELTGLYWAWKNLDADYLGLAHYRRHFAGKSLDKKIFNRCIKGEELLPQLDTYSVFVPKKRNYYIETLYSHYAHTHYASQLDETRVVLQEKYPEYVASFDRVTKRTYGYMFNMMILRKDLMNDYCTWLFDILFELENRLGEMEKELSFFQGRFYGRVSEIIFNVWLDKQLRDGKIQKKEIKELPVLYTEKVNWWKKGTSFAKAKFAHKKYEGSF